MSGVAWFDPGCIAHDHASCSWPTFWRVIWFNGLYPQPSSVRRQLSQSSGLGLRSIASVTGVNVLGGVLAPSRVEGFCAARGTNTIVQSVATPSVVRRNRIFI